MLPRAILKVLFVYSPTCWLHLPTKMPNDGAITKVGKAKSFSQCQSGILIKITFDSV